MGGKEKTKKQTRMEIKIKAVRVSCSGGAQSLPNWRPKEEFFGQQQIGNPIITRRTRKKTQAEREGRRTWWHS